MKNPSFIFYGRRRKSRARVWIAAIIALEIFFGAIFVLWHFSTPGTPTSASFIVEKGESAASIVRRLKAQEFIRSELVFRFIAYHSGLATRFQPGSHDLHDVRSLKEIAQRLAAAGTSPEETTLTIIEGWTIADIRRELERVGFKDLAGFDRFVGRTRLDLRTTSGGFTELAAWKKEFPFLDDKPDWISMEGYLFPDTYRIYKDGGGDDLVRKLLAEFGQKLSSGMRDEIVARKKTVFEIVTMASIIEREVRSDTDRAKVSDIFWRRLDIGMALQADSTVNYATGGSSPAVSARDLETDSPYNTYMYRGLPLGPISNPGLTSLIAAVRPEPNPYWYFLTDGEGNVHYAKTLDEHNRNKANYLR